MTGAAVLTDTTSSYLHLGNRDTPSADAFTTQDTCNYLAHGNRYATPPTSDSGGGNSRPYKCWRLDSSQRRKPAFSPACCQLSRPAVLHAGCVALYQ